LSTLLLIIGNLGDLLREDKIWGRGEVSPPRYSLAMQGFHYPSLRGFHPRNAPALIWGNIQRIFPSDSCGENLKFTFFSKNSPTQNPKHPNIGDT